jgi:hypothetical protein
VCGGNVFFLKKHHMSSHKNKLLAFRFTRGVTLSYPLYTIVHINFILIKQKKKISTGGFVFIISCCAYLKQNSMAVKLKGEVKGLNMLSNAATEFSIFDIWHGSLADLYLY